ncbi:hypothetical protein BC937DRAFT_87111, partial [Endogone sp. FLAS-F59071]
SLLSIKKKTVWSPVTNIFHGLAQEKPSQKHLLRTTKIIMSFQYPSLLSPIMEYPFTFVQFISATAVAFIAGYFLAKATVEKTSSENSISGYPIINRSASEHKMVLVVRTDLGMTKGKAAAQCAHAALANFKVMQKTNPEMLSEWEETGHAKITLKCDSEDQMLALRNQARTMGLCAMSIQDAGRTQIAAGSRTVLAIGPGPVKIINDITGHLKLY